MACINDCKRLKEAAKKATSIKDLERETGLSYAMINTTLSKYPTIFKRIKTQLVINQEKAELELQPKRVKYRRPQDGRGNKGNAHRGTQLAFGSFGIKTLESKWIDSRQIEAARVALNRYMNRQGQVWIRIFPDKPITRKPADVRMGKGKGDPAGWVAPVTPGRILFEVEGVSFDIAKEGLRLCAQKLPVKTKFIVRRDYDKNA